MVHRKTREYKTRHCKNRCGICGLDLSLIYRSDTRKNFHICSVLDAIPGDLPSRLISIPLILVCMLMPLVGLSLIAAILISGPYFAYFTVMRCLNEYAEVRDFDQI